MSTLTGVLIFAVVIFLISAAVSMLPLYGRKEGEHMHLLVAVSTGLMLGVLFLMILPEAFEEGTGSGYSLTAISATVLAGFVLVFAFDYYFNHRSGGGHTHGFTSMAAFGGMAIHAAFDGVSLAAGFVAGEDVGVMILVAICVHKCAEAFSLSSTMALALGRKKTIGYMTAFSAVTPLATVISYFIISEESGLTGPAMALSSGILLFVVACDLLPEIFHHADEDGGPSKRMTAFIGGLAIAILVWFVINQLTGGAGI